MRKVVFVTQQVDPRHPALAATVPKIRALAELVDEIVVLADAAVPGVLPANCPRPDVRRTQEGRPRAPLRDRAGAGAPRPARGRRRRAHVPDLRRARGAARPAPPRPPRALVHALAGQPAAAGRRAGLDRGDVRRRALVPASLAEAEGDRPRDRPRRVPVRPPARGGGDASARARALLDGEGPRRRARCGRPRRRRRRAARPRAALSEEERHHRAELEQLARELGLDGRVVLGDAVPRTELPALFATHDALVNNMRAGAPDKVVYEAAAACLPVLASNPIFDSLLDRQQRFSRWDPNALADADPDARGDERRRARGARAPAPRARRGGSLRAVVGAWDPRRQRDSA